MAGHKRSATASSGVSGLSRKSSSSSRRSSRRPSTSGSEKPRTSDQSIGRPAVLATAVEGAADATGLRAGPPPRPVRPDEKIDEFLEKLQQESARASPEPLKPDSRSRTFPLRKESQDDVDEPPSTLARRPSESTFQQRRQRQASFSRPLPETIPELKQGEEETRGRQLETSTTPLRARSSNRSGNKVVQPPTDVPPVPPIQRLQTQIDGNSLHTPTDSASSDGSSVEFASRIGSAMSSPPSSVASEPSRRPSKSDIHSIPAHKNEPQATKNQPAIGLPDPALRSLAFHGVKPAKESQASMSRPTAPEPLLPPRRRSITEGPESPMDPAIQRGLFTQQRPPVPNPASPPRRPSIPTTTPPKEPCATPPTAPETPLARRPTTPRSKGTCRGCTQPIIGKSVKAADGRLTGRYHRQCFVCKTCRAPFATADFYVINNEPYCERHYHTLNKSLCQCCDKGIEGQYLETEQRQKFHPACFKCQQCRVVLKEDYFEVGGKVYCERHAWEAGRQNTGGLLGAGGRKNPARRTTRLMMMG
ncbi:hypothetical protein H2199_007240 [Coniosporium tulheliwenetii]|uniref:Uncharacterized protein n=1 Tax=Coniosporium tulheliwenetii TaxID=3383036 RepID=A0ACC2YRQ1_9PEZI|nr:hypothetical protein H2199_007240 [Cladosporium sp. JES 115]